MDAAPQKKQPPQNGPSPSAIAASACRKSLFAPGGASPSTVGPSQTADTAYPLFGGHPRNRLASSAPGGASPVSLSWVFRTHLLPARGMRHPQSGTAANGCPTLPSRKLYHFIDKPSRHSARLFLFYAPSSRTRPCRPIKKRTAPPERRPHRPTPRSAWKVLFLRLT